MKHAVVKLSVLLCAMTLVGRVAVGGTIAWTGAANDGLWGTPGNWDGDAVPAATDTALFTQTLTLTPPADFTGTVQVTNSTLTLIVDEARTLSSAVKTGGTLIKTGTGTLTLHAAPGYNPGPITVAAGTVKFAGNGPYEAPGMFGTLTVARGASAEVVESPAANRHSVPVRAAKNTTELTDGTADQNYFKGIVGTMAAYTATWNACGVETRDRWLFTPNDTEPYLHEFEFVSEQFYATNRYYDVQAQALLLMPSSEFVYPTLSVDDFCALYLDEQLWGNVYFNNQNINIGIKKVNFGWHAFATAFHERTYSHYLRFRLTSEAFPSQIGIGPERLWNGVCFADLVVADGATLTVAADQAVALACTATTQINGSVTGGTGSVLAVMGGTLSADAAKFAAFSGTLEVPLYGTLDLANIPATPPFTVSSTGTFSAQTAAALPSNSFSGVIDIPADTTYTNTFGDAVSFTGMGTLVTDSLAGISEFKGSVVLRQKTDLTGGLDPLLESPATTCQLTDGAILTANGTSLINSFVDTIPDWNTDRGAWNLLNGQNTPRDYLNPIGMYVTNGVLVLTDDTGSQRNTAILTNRTFTARDAWEVNFTYSSKLLGKWQSEVAAEGASFVLTPSATTRGTNSQAYPGGTYGFLFYTYRAGLQGFAWIVNGASQIPVYKESEMGISLLKPIDITLSCQNAILKVVLKQEGHVFTTQMNIATAFASAASKYYLAIGGGSGWWGELKGMGGTQSAVYTYQTISNFTGTVSGLADEILDTADDQISFTSENWTLCNDMAFLTGGTNGLETGTGWSKTGAAVCTHELSPLQAFVIEYDQVLVSLDPSNGWAEGLSAYFRPSANISELSGSFQGTGNPSLAFQHYYWENKYYWDTNGSLEKRNTTPASNLGTSTKSLGTNHVRILYDGCGHFTATVTRGTDRLELKTNYPACLSWDKMYFGFKSASSHWANLKVNVCAPSLKFFKDATLTLDKSLEVAADATAQTGLEGFTPSNLSSLTFTSGTLQAGSTLNAGPAGRLAFDTLTVNGPATLAAKASGVPMLDTVIPNGPLTLTGNWTAKTGTVTFRVDATAIPSSGLLLADLANATYVGEGTPAFVCTGLDGTPLPGRYRISTANGKVRLALQGFQILLR